MGRTGAASAPLWHVFEERVRSLGHRRAVRAPQGELTFGELFQRAESLAAALAGEGLRGGDVVALALPNSLGFVPAFLALCRLSISVALVSPRYGISELQAVMSSLKPRGFLVSQALAREFAERIAGPGVDPREVPLAPLEGSLVFLSTGLPGSLTAGAGAGALEDDTAIIKVTSGSTGGPKGIALTAGQLLVEARNVALTLSLTPDDRIYAPAPVFHSYGFDLGVLGMLHSGAALTLVETFVPRKVLSEVSGTGATILLGVPSMYRFFLDTAPPSPPDLSRLRYALSCTAPLNPGLIAAFHERFRVPICQHYGSSETGAVTTHVPSAVLDRPDSVGVAMQDVEVAILDEDGNPLPSGREGEVVVRSGAIAKGYIMGPKPGISPFRDGRYWMGDVGYVDDKGFLYLRGRKDTLINIGGLKVSPDEVAMVLESFPAVREAAVIGMKDAAGEEMVYAAVTLCAPATETEILAYCGTRLSDYKIPRRLDIIDRMPRGPSGKIKLGAPGGSA